MAVIAIVVAIAIPNLRPILTGREAQAAIQSIQQTVWQGATAAAARGVVVELTRTGNTFTLRNTDTNAELKRFVLPNGVSSNWPVGTPLRFTPPGKVDTTSMGSFPSALTVTGNGKTTKLQISLIGEVRAGS
ncbi:MAG: type II secretion system protein [Trueperaceae bacterium]|nr:type II secretion system protein [Trueperaceae bacterium]